MDAKKIVGREIASLEHLRDRLRDMINGDSSVDIGSLLYSLNDDIGRLGGNKVKLEPREIRPRFFVETE